MEGMYIGEGSRRSAIVVHSETLIPINHATVVTNTIVVEEDFKTKVALNIKSIPKGTNLVLSGFYRNMYGVYARAEYNGRIYNIATQHLELV